MDEIKSEIMNKIDKLKRILKEKESDRDGLIHDLEKVVILNLGDIKRKKIRKIEKKKRYELHFKTGHVLTVKTPELSNPEGICRKARKLTNIKYMYPSKNWFVYINDKMKHAKEIKVNGLFYPQ